MSFLSYHMSSFLLEQNEICSDLRAAQHSLCFYAILKVKGEISQLKENMCSYASKCVTLAWIWVQVRKPAVNLLLTSVNKHISNWRVVQAKQMDCPVRSRLQDCDDVGCNATPSELRNIFSSRKGSLSNVAIPLKSPHLTISKERLKPCVLHFTP